jgi:hypothetical protein
MGQRRAGMGQSGLGSARTRIRQSLPTKVELVDDLLAPGSVPPLLTLEEAHDVLLVLEAAADAAPHTPTAERVSALADRLRVRLHEAARHA